MHMHMYMCMCMCMCMCMYCEGGPQRRHAASLAEGAQAQRTLFGRDATHVVGALLASDSEGGQGDCGATGPYFEGAFGKGSAAVVAISSRPTKVARGWTRVLTSPPLTTPHPLLTPHSYSRQVGPDQRRA